MIWRNKATSLIFLASTLAKVRDLLSENMTWRNSLALQLLGVHPNFRMVGHLPLNVLAAQWLSQVLRAIADRAWMYVYGRVPIHLLIPEPQWLVGRSIAPYFLFSCLPTDEWFCSAFQRHR